jgi:hypothetical protein
MTGLSTEQKLRIAESALLKIKSFTDINMFYPTEDPLFDAIARINDYCGRVLVEVGKP